MALTAIIGHSQEEYSVTNKYGGIIIPRLVITNATLHEALQLLTEACGQNSSKGTAPGFVVSLNGPEEIAASFTNARIITLVTNNVLFIDAIGYIATQSNFEMTIEKTAIRLHPKKKKQNQVEP